MGRDLGNDPDGDLAEMAHIEAMASARKPAPQSKACDRCTRGVMDSMNPHLWGDCKCDCHEAVG